METQTKQKMTCIKVIYNDDVRVIDFLSDLIDHEPIKALERFVRFSNREPVCLLHNCPADGLVLLILYKAPLGFNEGQNNLILYIHDDLDRMCKHFKLWFDNTSKDNGNVYDALNDILRLLYIEWAKLQDENTDKSFLG